MSRPACEVVARGRLSFWPTQPTLRGAPPGLPFVLDAAALRSGLNFTLTTTAGDVDLLGEVAGVGRYADAARDAVRLELLGMSVTILSLDALERSKRAAGRVKDLLDLAEIAEIRVQSRQRTPSK